MGLSRRGRVALIGVAVFVLLFGWFSTSGNWEQRSASPPPIEVDQPRETPLPLLAEERSPADSVGDEESVAVKPRPSPSIDVTVLSGETGAAVPGAEAAFLGHVITSLGTPRYPLDVDLPPGYVFGPESGVVSGRFSIYAEKVEVSLLVWPVVPLLVRVQEHDGTLVAGARVFQVAVGGWQTHPNTETGAYGEAEIHSLPAIAGEAVRVWVEKTVEGRGRTATASAGRIRTSAEGLTATVVLPVPKPESEFNGSIGIGGGAGGGFRGRSGSRRRKAGGTSVLEVTVVRRNGQPAPETLVVVEVARRKEHARTDATGVARFSGLPAGEATIRVDEVGFLSDAATFAVLADGVVTRSRLEEAHGRSLVVRVLDEEGVPRPGVRVSVNLGSVRWVHLENNVQRLGFITDSRGEFVFPNLPLQKVVVSARFGGRTAKGESEREAFLELSLPSPR